MPFGMSDGSGLTVLHTPRDWRSFIYTTQFLSLSSLAILQLPSLGTHFSYYAT